MSLLTRSARKRRPIWSENSVALGWHQLWHQLWKVIYCELSSVLGCKAGRGRAWSGSLVTLCVPDAGSVFVWLQNCCFLQQLSIFIFQSLSPLANSQDTTRAKQGGRGRYCLVATGSCSVFSFTAVAWIVAGIVAAMVLQQCRQWLQR